MAERARPTAAWDRCTTRPTLWLDHDEPDWTFREVEYGADGAWDVVSSCLHVAAHLDPLRQRLGPAGSPFQAVAPSAAVSAVGDRLTGAWQGRGRGQHLMVSDGFLAAAFGHGTGAADVSRRHFAHGRSVDATDVILRNLLGTIALGLRDGNPGGSVFIETVVLAVVRHAVRPVSEVRTSAARRGALSKAQLRIVIEAIDARLTEKLGLVELAALLGVSTRYLCRAFRNATGDSPHQFIIKRRVALARSLIETGRVLLSEAAHAAGFTDHSQMSATFRKVLGASPSHFRNV